MRLSTIRGRLRICDSQRKRNKNQSEANKKHFGNQRASERKLNDLAFADDVALLENSAVRAQKQLDAYMEIAAKVLLRLNIKKTKQMQLNQPEDTNIRKLVVDGKEIAVVDDFKYLVSQYISSTEKDLNTRIALAWMAFARLNRESWVLTEPLKKKARRIHQDMLPNYPVSYTGGSPYEKRRTILESIAVPNSI